MAEEVLRLGVDPTRAVAGFKQFTTASTGAKTSAAALTAAVGVLGGAFVALGAGRAIGGATRAAIDWELAMTGVAKTTELSVAELEAMGEELRALSEQIPVTANELASIAETAGQLGIAEANIVSFSEVMAGLGVATNLSATEAATSLARLANVMGTSQEDFDRLGSTVVDLGNNLATTEREIVEFGQRMAGAGRIAGFTEAQVLALGGALSSVGVEAEAGGTAIQMALLGINTAVAEGNEDLQLFAATAGVSAQQFAAAWRDDAGAAFTSFIEGLGGQGERAAGTLDQLGLGGARSARAFLSLANAGDLAREAMERGTEAWEENNALTEEAERFYAALGNQLQILQNQITNTAADIGQNFTPAIEWAITNIDTLTDAVIGLTQAFGVLLGLKVAAWGAATAAGVIATANAIRTATALSVNWGLTLANLARLIGPQGLIIAGVGLLTHTMMNSRKAIREHAEAVAAQEEALKRAGDEMRHLGDESLRTFMVQMDQALLQATERLRELEAAQERAGSAGRGMGASATQVSGQLKEQQRVVAELEQMIGDAARAYTDMTKAGREAATIPDAGGGLAGGAVDTSAAEDLNALLSEALDLDIQRRDILDAALDQRDAINALLAAGVGSLEEEVRLTRERDGLEKSIRENLRRRIAFDRESLTAAQQLGSAYMALPASLQEPVEQMSTLHQITIDATDEADNFQQKWVAAAQVVGSSMGGMASQVANIVGAFATGGAWMGAAAVGGAALNQMGSRDQELERMAQESGRAADALEKFADSLRDVPKFESELQMAEEKFQDFLDTLSIDEIFRLMESGDLGADEIARLREHLMTAFRETDNYTRALEAHNAALEEIARRQEEARQAMEADLRARVLSAQGRDAEAEAIRRNIARQEELREAYDLGGAVLQVWVMRQHAAIDAAREAERAFSESMLGISLQAREAAASGDELAATLFRAEQARAEEKRAAEEAYQAGEIGIETLRQWIDVIDLEYINAVEAAEQAVRDAIVGMEQDLRLRLLVAQGRDAEAQAMRNQIEIQELIAQGADAATIALLRQVQAAEAQARSSREVERATRRTTRETTRAANALNAPDGFRLSLRRWQAQSGVGSSSITNNNRTTQSVEFSGNIIIQAAPGDSGEDLYRKFRDATDKKARLGTVNPLVFGAEAV